MIYKKYDNTIPYALMNLGQAFLVTEQAARDYGTDVKIYYAEIHALMLIAENPGININCLAELLGITKASASEVVRKIERKGLVSKESAKDRRSLAVHPTEKGLTAHLNHLKAHDVFNKMIDARLAKYDDKTRQRLLEFIHDVTDDMEKLGDVFK